MSSSGRTIAVGDIHGCAQALDALLETLELQQDDTLVMLGDAIDRGPDSKGVVDRLLAVAERCELVPILGNHEQMMLDARDATIPLSQWKFYGGSETLDSYGSEHICKELESHIEFVRTWGDFYETPSHFFAHGNYLPGKRLSKQPWHLTRWQSLKETTPDEHCSGKTAVLGHTSQKSGEVLNLGHLVCIDTYCHGGGWLTALEPETGKLWQANNQGQTQEGTLQPPR